MTNEVAEEDHEEESTTITSLTTDQMKAVGITLDTIELKGLTSVIKANGELRVANNSKANVTSMFGGGDKNIDC